MKRICTVGVPQEEEGLKRLLQELPFHVEPISQNQLREVALFIDILAVSPLNKNLRLIEEATRIYNIPVVVVMEDGEERKIEKLLCYIENEETPFIVICNREPTILTTIKTVAVASNKVKLEVGRETFLQLRVFPSICYVEKFKGKKLLSRSSLSFKEGLMLKLLFEKPGKVVPYEKFLELGIKEESLPVYISKLRRTVKYLEPSLVIKSNRQNGYTLNQAL